MEKEEKKKMKTKNTKTPATTNRRHISTQEIGVYEKRAKAKILKWHSNQSSTVDCFNTHEIWQRIIILIQKRRVKDRIKLMTASSISTLCQMSYEG